MVAAPSPDFAAKAAAENFPVAGWFIAPALRPAVASYYAFARAADDIADGTDRTVIQKLKALDDMEASIPQGLGPILQKHNVPLTTATDLLTAFRADARGTPTRTLADLMAYCRHSAAPVGRFLLSLHGETAGQSESDALCAALQILNHVQDARADIETLKRCYIPLDWLAAEGVALMDLLDPDNASRPPPGVEPLRDDYAHASPAPTQAPDPAKITRCLQRLLDQAEHLLVLAAPLPRAVNSRGLAAQSAAILCLAQRLLARLRKHDTWALRVRLTPLDWLMAACVGLRVRVLGP
ncbi:MAG: squalene/phytoene synthase family protein [Rhodospirillaceae bacterium]|nr:squalene/phytoene synthase family protein [Rhodospirillaceae bacterium]